MIYELNEVLRELLYLELPMRKGDVDIEFDLPKKDWSSRLSKPTLNIFLYDLLENVELRGSEQWEQEDNEDGTVSLRRNPVRMNFFYLITSWAKEIQDEQQLLSVTLATLLRQASIPNAMLPEELKNQPVPIRLEVAQNKGLAKMSDFWGTMDNDPHPGIRLTVTMTVDPYKSVIAPRVAVSEMRFHQAPSPESVNAGKGKKEVFASKTYFAISGNIKSQKYSPSTLRMILTETGKEIPVQEDGNFKIQRLSEGEYHLDILFNDRVLRHEKIKVPSPQYEIVV